MTVPDRSITIQDGGMGVSLPSPVIHALIGVASTGTKNSPQVFTSASDVEATFGIGPLVEAAQFELENGTGAVVCIRTNDSVAGTITTAAPSQVGDGTCALSGTPNNAYRIAVEIVTEGELGSAAFKYSLDAGPDDAAEEKRNWSRNVAVPSGGTYAIPNTGLTLTFANGTPVSFQIGDLFTFSTSAPAFQLVDLNTSLDALAAYSGYWRFVHVVGEITAAIATAVDSKLENMAANLHRYRYAICEAVDLYPIGTVTKTGTTPPDLTVSGVPYGSFSWVVDITLGGVLGTMKFRVSGDGGDTWTSEITSDVSGVHDIPQSGVTFTFASGTYNVDNEYTFGSWNNTRAEWASDLQTAYASFVSNRAMMCAGHGDCTLPSGKIPRRNIAWAIASMLTIASISDDIGEIEGAGTLPGFLDISHDEAANPGLDDAGFATARTWVGIEGLYVNQGRMAAGPTSDYDLVQYRQVMDEVCRLLDTGLALLVNKKTRVDATTGFILEQDARAFERKLQSPQDNNIVIPNHASQVTVSLRRNENLLSTRTLNADVAVVGLAYLKTVHATVGYKNPALVAV